MTHWRAIHHPRKSDLSAARHGGDDSAGDLPDAFVAEVSQKELTFGIYGQAPRTSEGSAGGRPPSPEKPIEPLPATVLIVPPDTCRTRLLPSSAM